MPRIVFESFITLFDYNRIKSYCRNQIDYHLILDLLPSLTKLYYEGKLG
jgi:N-acetyltransferase 10